MADVAALVSETHHALARERGMLAAWSDDILRMQMEIARIPSPTFAESDRAAWMAGRLRDAGWTVRSDDAGNVVASAHESGQPAVAVCSHLDTVYAADTPSEVARRGERVTGAGICDNSRGLAVLVAIARLLRPRLGDLDQPVELVATTAEEGIGDLRGAKHYVDQARPQALIALDGAGDERIVNTALGSRRFRIAFSGSGGHSWSAFGIANPVHAAARCAGAIASVPLTAGSALTVSRIGGGASINAIPQDAWLEVDLRGASEPALRALEREVLAIAESALRDENSRRTGGAELVRTVEYIGLRACGHTPERSPLVAAALEATRLVGRRPELATSSTDANAAMALGIPAIAIGAGGRGGDTHSSAEWFDNTGAGAGAERALTLIASAARVA